MIRLHLPRFSTYISLEEREGYLLLILSFLSLLLFGLGGINLLIGNTTTLYSTLKAGKMYNTALAEKIAALNKAEEQLDQIRSKLEVIDQTVPTSATQANFLEELFTDSTRAKLTLTAVSFREKEKEGCLTSDPFDLVLRGERDALIRFLEELEKGWLVLIESFSYSRSSTGEERGEVILKGKAFSYEQISQ